MTTLQLLSTGAAKGLFAALQAKFEAECGVHLAGQFGAVGAMREALLSGADCDLMVRTDAILRALAQDGHLRADTIRPLGRVKTSVAALAGQALPMVGTPETFKAALLTAEAIYFPDPERANAGIHFAGVRRTLGIHGRLALRLRPFANGATAIREMAAAGLPSAIGCTQVSEILYSPGVQLAGTLPVEFELATVYSAAASRRARGPALVERVIALLTSTQTQALRSQGGFEPTA